VRAALVAAAALALAPAARAADWSGTFSLPTSAEAVRIAVQLNGSRAVVALGPGHAGRSTVPARLRRGRLKFALGGVAFDGTLHGGAIAGRVTQGALRGSFRLTSGRDSHTLALGLYRSASGEAVAIVEPGEGFPTWLVELPSGNIHGLGATLRTVGTRAGNQTGGGALAVSANGLTWNSVRFTRVPLRQREVRVGDVAATLTLPPGAGPFPAVAMVHGSGPHGREEFQVFGAYCALLGIAVLADDKRGIGQSRGTYPGEAATPHTVDVLARDAQAEVRYLASLPQVDATRVGLLGDSQAGWIIALAAARERAVRWAVPLVGPTVSVDESDAWGALAGKGVAAPSGTNAEMLAQVRAAGRGGFDPEPSLRKLGIPVHWVFVDDDRNVPTELCIERLRALQGGHDFTWTVVHATHTLLELPSGLNVDIARSRGFASGLWPDVGAFLRKQGIVRS
jgi:dienelactone hydrolase